MVDTQNNVVLTGSIVDSTTYTPGVFAISLSPQTSGNFLLFIMFNGLNVDQSPYEV